MSAAGARDVTDEVAAEHSGSLACEEQRARVLAVLVEDGVIPVFHPIVNLQMLEIGGCPLAFRRTATGRETTSPWALPTLTRPTPAAKVAVTWRS
jgi:hypothetical protein